MDSVDDSQSILGASDALFEHVCGPCNYGKIVKEGNHYCQNCAEYLCDSCRDHHERLPLTSSHTIVSGSNLPSSTANSGPRLFIYCSCNRNHETEVFCEDHKDVVCLSCKTVKHKNCKTEKVRQKCVGYKSSQLDDVLNKNKILKSEFDRLLNKYKKDADDLLSMRKSCEKEISKFRKEMDNFLDSLEQTLLKELDKHSKEQQNYIDRHIASLKTASQMIDSDTKQLTDAKSDGRAADLFTVDVQMRKNLIEYDSMLREAETDYKKTMLAFERNKLLDRMQKDIDALGYITFCFTEDVVKTQKLFMRMKVSSLKQVSVKHEGDKGTSSIIGCTSSIIGFTSSKIGCAPWITGCTFMSNDYVVLCDFGNHNIKVLNSEWKFIDILQIESAPWSLSAADNDTVIVTLPNKKQLKYVQIFPQIKSGATIQLDKECYGIVVSDNKIFASCKASIYEGGDVRILDLEGNQKQKIILEQMGSLKYQEPMYLTINSKRKLIFVSNRENPSSVTCLTFDGNIVYQCTSEELEQIRGIYLDAQDNAYVCDPKNHKLHIISNDGRHCGTLIGPEDGLKYPYSIAVRESDGTLVIGCGSNSLFLFQLS